MWMLQVLMCSLKLMRLVVLMCSLKLMRLLVLLMHLIHSIARTVERFAARSALHGGAFSIAEMEHARHTGKAYLIPRLINWCQLVSLMPLYPSFPCTPHPGVRVWSIL